MREKTNVNGHVFTAPQLRNNLVLSRRRYMEIKHAEVIKQLRKIDMMNKQFHYLSKFKFKKSKQAKDIDVNQSFIYVTMPIL
jgi:hypothetical protein